MKDVLIMSYEGNVEICDTPTNAKKFDLIEIARMVIMDKKNKPLTDLNNVEYYVNDEIYKVQTKLFGEFGDIPDDFRIFVDYEDAKKL